MATELVVTKEGDPISPVSADPTGVFYDNDGSVHLYTQNTGSDIVATWVGQRPVDHPDRPLIDRTFTQFSGLITINKATSPKFFNDGFGKVQVTFDSVSGLTVAAIRIATELP